MRRKTRMVAAGGAIALGVVLSLGSPAHAGDPDAGTDGTRVTGTDGTRVTGTDGTDGTRVTGTDDREY